MHGKSALLSILLAWFLLSTLSCSRPPLASRIVIKYLVEILYKLLPLKIFGAVLSPKLAEKM